MVDTTPRQLPPPPPPPVQAKQLPAVQQEAYVPTILTPEIKDIASMAAQSGFFADAKNLGQACMKILFGKDYGMSPSEALDKLFVINGKIGMYSEGMSDRLHRVPELKVIIRKLDEDECALSLEYKGEIVNMVPDENNVMTEAPVRFTIKQARALGFTKNKPMWEYDPESMLYARTISRLYKRWGKSYVNMPSYTVEELSDFAADGTDPEKEQSVKQLFAGAGKKRGTKAPMAVGQLQEQPPEDGDPAPQLEAPSEDVLDVQIEEDGDERPKGRAPDVGSSNTAVGSATVVLPATSHAQQSAQHGTTDGGSVSATSQGELGKPSEPSAPHSVPSSPPPSTPLHKPVSAAPKTGAPGVATLGPKTPPEPIATKQHIGQMIAAGGVNGWQAAQCADWCAEKFGIQKTELSTKMTVAQCLQATDWVTANKPGVVASV